MSTNGYPHLMPEETKLVEKYSNVPMISKHITNNFPRGPHDAFAYIIVVLFTVSL